MSVHDSGVVVVAAVAFENDGNAVAAADVVDDDDDDLHAHENEDYVQTVVNYDNPDQDSPPCNVPTDEEHIQSDV